MSWKLPPTGLRREVSILLPVALLLLVVLSAFTLFSYRDAVVRLAGEHREQAIRAARRAAGEIGREELLKRIDVFAEESKDTIIGQTKKMGSSLDWSRYAFTLETMMSLSAP